MPTITVAHLPELTMERALEIIAQRFAGTYDVYQTNLWFGLRLIVVK